MRENLKDRGLSYQHVDFVPRKCILKSRKDADTTCKIGSHTFQLPIIPANMSACINPELAAVLADNGFMYVMHRFFKDKEQGILNFVRDFQKKPLVSISVGVGPESRNLVRNIFAENLRVDFWTIDIAHGHAESVITMAEFIKGHSKGRIIAGNVASRDGVDFLSDSCDVIKVGIGGGAACSTRLKTGFHVPMFTCMQNCTTPQYKFSSHYKAPSVKFPNVIADGGIRENGDIAKAMIAGGTYVMAGSIFSACIDSPAETIKKLVGRKLKTFKRYYGSASAKNKGSNRNVEGFEIDIPCNGMTYLEKMAEIKDDLQSSISYAGVKSAEDLTRLEIDCYLT